MKMLTAIIKPFKLDDVHEALIELVFLVLPYLKRVVLADKKAYRVVQRGGVCGGLSA